ncbi:MAG: class I SAM-dependent methyltransferase [Deltaproteobacteria bacterium]|nr:class I SAM-dependent methyltransferase [Deltaproteobacteria bacterium]
MDKFSPEKYDGWYETPFGRLCDRLEKEAVFSLFKPKGLVIDVGCGTGNYTLELARRGVKTVGIDSSFDMIVFAKTKAEREGLKPNFVIGRAEAIPFRNDVFDGILEVTTLCFASNPDLATAEMKRILKPTGQVVLGELNTLSYWAILRRIKVLFKKSSYRWARFFSLRKLNGLLKETGFKDLRWSSCLYFPPINSRWFLKRWGVFENTGKVLSPQSGAFIVVAGTK